MSSPASWLAYVESICFSSTVNLAQCVETSCIMTSSVLWVITVDANVELVVRLGPFCCFAIHRAGWLQWLKLGLYAAATHPLGLRRHYVFDLSVCLSMHACMWACRREAFSSILFILWFILCCSLIKFTNLHVLFCCRGLLSLVWM